MIEWPDISEQSDIQGVTGALVLSPDGRRFSYEVHQADIAADSYRATWFVGDVSGAAPPRAVGDGGDPTLFRSSQGSWISTPARWSPDGRWLAYRRKADGQVQVWISRTDGSEQRQLTHNAADVADFDWSADGGSITFLTDAPRTEIAVADAAEARSGYRVDDQDFNGFYRVQPLHPAYRLTGGRPLHWRIDLADGRERPVTEAQITAEAARAPAPALPDRPDVTQIRREPGAGRSSWLENPEPAVNKGFLAPKVLAASPERAGSPPLVCRSPACHGALTNLGWSSAGEVAFLNTAQGRRNLYLWSPRRGAVRPVLSTERHLSSCVLSAVRVICLADGPTRPRQVVAIDLADGRLSVLADPNPDIGRLAFGEVERLAWTNPNGVETWGYLLLPTDYVAGRRYPLVIVPYEADACLRGGTGGEFPTHAFAANGMAVLCYSEPVVNRRLYEQERDPFVLFRADYKDMVRQRNIQLSLETVIAQLAARGLIDPARVGLTGLSAGVETVQYMLIHSRAIAAAATAGGGADTMSYYGSTAFSRSAMMLPIGWGDPAKTKEAWGWPEMSLSLNADHIDTPLLIQAADTEYLYSALQIAVTWRAAGKPIDVYVLPHEFHVKWSPAHRLAVLTRNLDWFRFWLKDEEDADPAKAEQYRIWHGLRDGRHVASGSSR